MIRIDVTRSARSAEIGGQVTEAAARALEDGAAAIVREARVRAGGGTLARSISADAGSDPLVWDIRASAPYARFVEFGTRRMAARPYLGPAARLVWPRLMAALRRIIKGDGT
ncbi:MAG: HK97 gp10 family phage protein [Alphaproteobacteria bacterium]|nr:MAG: HK97 gp10 family phage protein [Alphaproteobacteria bacterium]